MCVTRLPVKQDAAPVLSSAALDAIRKDISDCIIPDRNISDGKVAKELNTQSHVFKGDESVSDMIRSNKKEDNVSETDETSTQSVRHKEYVDRSQELPNIISIERKARGGKGIPFPLKLHQMLDEVENAGLTSIISWRSHGRAFMVHKRDDFVDCILPVYFQQNKFASFQRQLNLYGFSRISCGKDKGVYYHESFLRGRQLLATEMVRIKIKGNSTRSCSNPYAEPNFYSMRPLGLLQKETLSRIYDFSTNYINDHMAQVLNEEIIKMFTNMPSTTDLDNCVSCSKAEENT